MYRYESSPRSSSSSSPAPTFSRIRFNNSPQYIEPPSPYMSPGPTSYPSGHYTQSTSRPSLSNSSFNPSLRYESDSCIKVGFYSSSRDIRYQANSNDPLAQSAMAPNVQINTIAIVANGLPWTINITTGPSTITVGDVLKGLLHSLETPVTRDEFLSDSQARRDEVQRNFTSRCTFMSKRRNSRLEENDDWNGGVIRRGDYLGGWSFRGLTVRRVEGTNVVMRLHWSAASSS